MGRTRQNYQPPLTLRQLDWLRYNGGTCHFVLIEDINFLFQTFYPLCNVLKHFWRDGLFYLTILIRMACGAMLEQVGFLIHSSIQKYCFCKCTKIMP